MKLRRSGKPTTRHGFPVPKLHKASGQFYLGAGSIRRYLGKHDGPRWRPNYVRTLAEIDSASFEQSFFYLPVYEFDRSKKGLMLRNLTRKYRRHIDRHYGRQQGAASSEWYSVHTTLGYLDAMYGRLPVSELSGRQIARFEWGLMFEGIPPHVAKKHVRRVRRLIRWAGDNDMISRSQVDGFDVSYRDTFGTLQTFEQPRSFDYEFYSLVIGQFVQHLPPSIRAMVVLQHGLGLHPHELVGLRVKDFSFRNNTIRLTIRVPEYEPLRDATDNILPPSKFRLPADLACVVRPWLVGRQPDEFLFSPKRDACLADCEVRHLHASNAILTGGTLEAVTENPLAKLRESFELDRWLTPNLTELSCYNALDYGWIVGGLLRKSCPKENPLWSPRWNAWTFWKPNLSIRQTSRHTLCGGRWTYPNDCLA